MTLVWYERRHMQLNILPGDFDPLEFLQSYAPFSSEISNLIELHFLNDDLTKTIFTMNVT